MHLGLKTTGLVMAHDMASVLVNFLFLYFYEKCILAMVVASLAIEEYLYGTCVSNFSLLVGGIRVSAFN